MTLSSVDLHLFVGPGLPLPAPPTLMEALRAVEVTQSDSSPSGFQLTFAVDAGAGTADALIGEALLATSNRVAIVVVLDGFPKTLIDGFITHFQSAAGNTPGQSTLVVTGEDVSVAMDRQEKSFEYPLCDDVEIFLAIMVEYAYLGIVPMPFPGLDPLVPNDHVPQQDGTDRAMVQRLAQRNGYVFFVGPGPVPFANVAYWGPPPRFQPPQVVLDAVGPWSNVDSLQFEYDPASATAFAGFVMETTLEPNIPIPVLTMASTRLPPFASEPALNPLSIARGSVRTQLWDQHQELDPVAAEATAQALTNLSTDNVVTGTCELSPARVGSVVTAPGVVGVRNATFDYDGLYYLPRAAHHITLGQGGGWDYRQTLTLSREGTGSTTTVLDAL